MLALILNIISVGAPTLAHKNEALVEIYEAIAAESQKCKKRNYNAFRRLKATATQRPEMKKRQSLLNWSYNMAVINEFAKAKNALTVKGNAKKEISKTGITSS